MSWTVLIERVPAPVVAVMLLPVPREATA